VPRNNKALPLLLLALACVHLPPEEATTSAEEAPEGRLAVAEGWLAGTVRGRASGAPVVFVHGLGGNFHFFDAQLEHVSHRARAIAYDQRGCGGSALAPRKKYDLDTLAGDLGAILDAARAERAVLVGHSFGADVISQYAGQHPERVAALVLLDPPGDVRARLATLAPELAGGDEASFWRGLDTLTEKLLAGARPDTRKAVLTSTHATPRDVLQRMMQGLATFDPVEALRSYPGPITSIVVASDPATAPRDPRIRVVTVGPSSHWPMLDQPEQVNQALDAVLTSIQ
jgi:pimeloyl-ACP methyl ester carboxylesterase